MKVSLRKILPAVFAGILILGIVGCSNGKSQQTKVEPSFSTGATSTSSDTSSADKNEYQICTKCFKSFKASQLNKEGICEDCANPPSDSEASKDKKSSSSKSKSSSGSSSKYTTCPVCGEKSLRSSVESLGMCQTCYVNKEMDAGRTDFSYSGESDSDSGSSSARRDKNSVECPICGGATTKSQLNWQGMCSSCFSTYEQLKDYHSDF